MGREPEVVCTSRFSVYRKSLKTMVVFLICASLPYNTEVARYDVIQALGVQRVSLLPFQINFPLSSDYESLVILAPLLICLVLFPRLSCH